MRKMGMINLIVGIVFFMPLTLFAQTTLPFGWRFPNDADFTNEWSINAPIHARTDFNGDGLEDDAWILLSTQSRAWGLFIFTAKETGTAEVLPLAIYDPDKDHGTIRPQQMGVEVVNPGKYITACGKGHWPCNKDEPAFLQLIRPAIKYYQYESASSFFWWDEKGKVFKRIWISD